MKTLPFDIFLSVFDVLDSQKSLYSSCLVSKTFYEAALPSLYRDVDLRPLYSDNSSKFIKYRAFETIEKHPHLRSYVRTINHFVSAAVVSDGVFDVEDVNISFLSTFTNLTSYTLHSFVDCLSIPGRLFLEIVEELLKLPPGQFRELHLHFNVYSYHCQFLTKFRNLQRITLGRPSRFVLAHLPEWIQTSGMSDTLEAFHILDGTKIDTTSIGPIQPHLSNIRALTLGHHALMLSSMDLLDVLRDTPKVEELSLHYNNWINTQHEPQYIHPNRSDSSGSSGFPGLSRLLGLQITHQGVGNKSQYNAMLRWILQLTPPELSYSTLERLSIVPDDHREFSFTSSRYFAVFLKHYLPARTHAGRNQPAGLKMLKLPFVIFTPKEFYDAAVKGGELQDVEVGVRSKEAGHALIEGLFEKKDVRIAAKFLKVLHLRSSATPASIKTDPPTIKSRTLESKRTESRKGSHSRVGEGRKRGDIVSGREFGPARLRQVKLDTSLWEVDQIFEKNVWVKGRKA